jgi:hypothetical protein
MRRRLRDGMAPRSAWVWAWARVGASVLVQAQVLERAVEACRAASATHDVALSVKVLGKSAPTRAGLACVLTCGGCCDGGARDRAEEVMESVIVRRTRQVW